jgi:4-carboxymuconolactone decarboxylase
MIALAILIARRFGDEMKAHMRYALNVGLSREEILEIILHTANYTCWGAGVDATRTGKDILGAG